MGMDPRPHGGLPFIEEGFPLDGRSEEKPERAKPDLSLCLIAEGGNLPLLRVLLPQYVEALKHFLGECIIAGELEGLALSDGMVALRASEEVRSLRRGRLRNPANSRARGWLIISGDCTAVLGPPDWPRRLLEWTEPISQEVPYMFDFEVASPHGNRYCDWTRVDASRRLRNLDYGEQSPGLALGAGYLGMTWVAWNASGGFNEHATGPGEESEFTRRVGGELRTPLVFCDAIFAVRASEPLGEQLPGQKDQSR